MSKTQKFLIASGVLTVVSIVAIAAFPLGVYVGERGWTAGPPSMAGQAVVRLLASRASSRQVTSRDSRQEDAQPRIRGKCPLELAGYDISQVPMASLCVGWSLAWPLEVDHNLVPNS